MINPRDTSITYAKLESVSLNGDGYSINAACAYVAGVSTETDSGAESIKYTNRDVASTLSTFHNISSISLTNGQCRICFGSAITLGATALALNVRSSMSGFSLGQSVC